jgi:hypothetical protein
MPQNTLPSWIYDLMQLAGNMATGLERHGSWLRMTQTKPAEFREALDHLRGSENAFASLRSAKAAAGKWMNAADKALTEWLAKARLAVMLARGVQWSETWLEAGFTHRRTNLPKAIVPRIELARRVVDFFARNPEFGVPHANVTASHGRKACHDAIGARQVRRQLTSECATAKSVRDAAERNLRRKMRGVVLLLSAGLQPTDPRWLDFGLNQPRARSSKRCTLIPDSAVPITHLSPPQPTAAVAA